MKNASKKEYKKIISSLTQEINQSINHPEDCPFFLTKHIKMFVKIFRTEHDFSKADFINFYTLNQKELINAIQRAGAQTDSKTTHLN